MHTVVLGVRHYNAPIEVREQCSFTQNELADALRDLLTYQGVEEAAIVSTCNRTEIYATVTETETGLQSLKSFLKDYKAFDYNQQKAHAFLLLHEDAIIHLFRVASGLDSLILGEGQILSQIKESLKVAMEVGTSGDIIEKLFKSALTVGKSVRSETGIAQRDPNVPKAVIAFMQDHYPALIHQPVVVVGAGKMAELFLDALLPLRAQANAPLEEVFILNRSKARCEALAQHDKIQALPWAQLPEALGKGAWVVVATGSKRYVVDPSHMTQTSKGWPQVLIDIAVPRNVDPAVTQHAAVALFNTDDLQNYGQMSEEHRLRLIHEAHLIIEREYQRFYQWIAGRPALPVISELRAKIENVRKTEVADFVSYCPETKKSCGVIDSLSRSLVAKLLHDPTIRLRNTPELDDIYKQAEILSALFNIPNPGGGCRPPLAVTPSAKTASSITVGHPVAEAEGVGSDNILPLKFKQPS